MILHDIKYVPSFYRIVPIHHTNPNGKKVTFKTPVKLLLGKRFETPQSAASDYTFKIGGTTDNFKNGNDAAWTSLPLKTFTEFMLLEVPINSHVLVIYNGTLTQTDIVSALYVTTDTLPINPSTQSIKPNPKIAAGDIMIYPKLVTGFDSVVALSSANIFSQQRTFSELANSSDLTNFNTGITNLPITTESGIGHLYLKRRSTAALTVNITTNQADPKKEIIAYATPLNNEFYPTTSDGVNPPAINFDRINDTAIATSNAFCDFLNIWTLPVGTVRTLVHRYRPTTGTNIAFSAGRSSNQGLLMGNYFVWVVNGGTVVDRRVQILLPPIYDNQVVTVIWEFTRPTAFDGSPVHNFVKCWVNGRRIDNTDFILHLQLNNLTGDPMVNSKSNTIGMTFNGIIGASGTAPAIEYNAFFDRALTAKEVREISIGSKDVCFAKNPSYAWDSTQIVSTNQIPQVGTLAAPNLVLTNHTNTLGTLFI